MDAGEPSHVQFRKLRNSLRNGTSKRCARTAKSPRLTWRWMTRRLISLDRCVARSGACSCASLVRFQDIDFTSTTKLLCLNDDARDNATQPRHSLLFASGVRFERSDWSLHPIRTNNRGLLRPGLGQKELALQEAQPLYDLCRSQSHLRWWIGGKGSPSLSLITNPTCDRIVVKAGDNARLLNTPAQFIRYESRSGQARFEDRRLSRANKPREGTACFSLLDIERQTRFACSCKDCGGKL